MNSGRAAPEINYIIICNGWHDYTPGCKTAATQVCIRTATAMKNYETMIEEIEKL